MLNRFAPPLAAAALVLGFGQGLASTAQAQDLSAGFVATEMNPELRYPFVSGVLEGLAYARFVADGNSEEPGMACIYNWFYQEDGTVDTIFAAFAAFPEHLPGAVMGALIERRCGS